MKLTYALKIAICACVILSTRAFSEPSTGIETLIRTPASAFDVFLNELYFKLNGPKYIGMSHLNEQLNVFNIKYDYKSNIISIGMHIGPKHKRMSGFAEGDMNTRRKILTNATQETAVSLGIVPRDVAGIPMRFGLIQQMTIRNGWGANGFDEASIKDEIAERVELTLVYAWEDKLAYQVRRTISGQYEFSTIAK